MDITPGTRLGPYEIIEVAGSGGPPPLAPADVTRELWRGLAVAHLRTRC